MKTVGCESEPEGLRKPEGRRAGLSGPKGTFFRDCIWHHFNEQISQIALFDSVYQARP